MNQDAEHLRLLSIFHYVFAGITALFACIPLVHVVMGISMLSGSFGRQSPHFMGWLFVLFGLAAIVIGWIFAGLAAFAGHSLGARKHYTYCLVIAALSCVFVPLGTVLGVFTIIVLQRPTVKALFCPTPPRQ